MKSVLEEKEQFVVDGSGQRVGVLLDLSTYERLREAAEDNADVRVYRAAKERVAKEVASGAWATLDDYRAKRLRKPR